MTTIRGGVWTYSGNPGHSAVDLTRFLLGDTDPSDPLLTNGEIEWTLSQYNNTPLVAAIRACEGVIAKFSRMSDEAVGQVKINFRQKAQNMRDLQITLRQRLAMEDAAPFAGGISVSQKQQNVQNTDNVRPDFAKHMMENDQIAPWVTQTALGLWLAFEG